MNDVNNSIFQLKDLKDQAQKLLHNFQNNVNVALNLNQLFSTSMLQII